LTFADPLEIPIVDSTAELTAANAWPPSQYVTVKAEGYALYRSTGSAWAQAATGNVPFTTPRYYGAVMDGTTNDTSAFIAARDAAGIGGRVIIDGSGTYSVTSFAPLAHQTWVISSSATIQMRANANTTIFPVTVVGVTIQGGTLDGNRANNTSGNGVTVTGTTDLRSRDVTFKNFDSVGIGLTNVQRAWIEDNRFFDITGSGVRLHDPGAGLTNDDVWIEDNTFDGCQSGLVAGNASIQSHGTSTISHRRIHVVGNTVLNSGRVGIGLDSLDFSSVESNDVVGLGGGAGECIAFTGSNNLFKGNYCYGAGTGAGAGILLWGIASQSNAHNRIIDNVCTNCGQGIAIVWGNDNTAITDVTVANNHCYSNNYGIQSYLGVGVTVGNTWKNIWITDNNLIGNVTGPHTFLLATSINLTNNAITDADRATRILQDVAVDRLIYPLVTDLYDLGTSSLRWRNAYTNTVFAEAGTVGAPSQSFRVDPDTGVYRAGVNTLGFAIGGVQGAELLEAADGETALLVRRNVAGAFTVQRVSMGAIDSGGSGYKVLRVPN
jgi:hypothetical protein